MKTLQLQLLKVNRNLEALPVQHGLDCEYVIIGAVSNPGRVYYLWLCCKQLLQVRAAKFVHACCLN